MKTISFNHGNLKDYDYIVVNSSAGKDSQTSLRAIVSLADRNNYPRERIIVSHQCLGRMEWPGTQDLARAQAEHYGLEFIVTKYRNRHSEPLSLLEYVSNRGKWPDNKNRYCTSDFKRGPGGRVLTMLRKRLGKKVKVLYVFGFRAEESPNRAKKPVFEINERQSNGVKDIRNYLPIHDWTESEVWADIEESGVPHHEAYDLGMPRLSCMFCIFAPKPALIIAGRAHPELLDEYIELEKKINHTFRHNFSLVEVREAIEKDEEPGAMNGSWNM